MFATGGGCFLSYFCLPVINFAATIFDVYGISTQGKNVKGQYQPISHPQQPPHFPAQYYAQDEIDLKELFLALWQGKWIIIVCVALFMASAALFALRQPNIYQASGVLIVEPNPYGFVETQGGSSDSLIDAEASAILSFLSSKSNLEAIAEASGLDGSALSEVELDKDRNTDEITVSVQSTDPERAYQVVKAYVGYVNQAYKVHEARKVDLAMGISAQLVAYSSGKVSDVLAEKYAQQLYKDAILNAPESTLIQVVQQPVKPSSHIKPKRLLIIVLGTLLGGILGVAIVLIHFAFRQQD
ncbi:lipopolysaccharide biosynthesis protein [Vibrio fluvialis]|nr:lipopolysaccharide biosynthesis protein [Vibrio fluvialis]